jgi:hypothetical protein
MTNHEMPARNHGEQPERLPPSREKDKAEQTHRAPEVLFGSKLLRRTTGRASANILLAIISGLLLYFAYRKADMNGQARTLYVVMLVLASYFPITAIMYLWFKLGSRLKDILEYVVRYDMYPVYAASGGRYKHTDRDLQTEFDYYLDHRFVEYYSPWEINAYAGLLTFLIIVLDFAASRLLTDTSRLPAPLDSTEMPVAASAIIGLFGATVGAMVLVFKHYRAFDISAGTYLQASVALVVGTFVGVFLKAFFAKEILVPLTFGLAFLTSLSIDFLIGFIKSQFASRTGVTIPAPLTPDLSEVIKNPEAIESLGAMSVFSIAELATIDPMRLYLNIPQAIGSINGWIDQALLRHYFSKIQDDLEAAGILGFSQVFAAGATNVTASGVDWNTNAIVTGKVDLDKKILSSVASVVKSGAFDIQLATISSTFRLGRFAPPSYDLVVTS